jgi:hypothetical protein
MNAIRGRNEAKKELRPRGDRAVECHLGLCLQQNVSMGGGGGRKINYLSNIFSGFSAWEIVHLHPGNPGSVSV